MTRPEVIDIFTRAEVKAKPINPTPLDLRVLEVRDGITRFLYQNEGEEGKVTDLRLRFEKRFSNELILAGEIFDRLLDMMESDGEIAFEEKSEGNKPFLFCRLTTEAIAVIEKTPERISIAKIPSKRISHQG